jgi:hypothetical protein
VSEPTQELELFGGEPESALIRFAREAAEVHGVSKALAATSFVPASMQGKPHEVTAAIMAGHEIGMSPMTALRCIDVIEGRPAVSAGALRGLAIAAGCKIEILESTNTRCRMRGIGPGQDSWTETQWTADDAARANLAGKKNWTRYPRQMLVARATGDLVRLIAPNVAMGMPYSKEELSDGGSLDAGEAAVGAPKMAAATRAVRRRTDPLGIDDPSPGSSTQDPPAAGKAEPADPPASGSALPAAEAPKEIEAPPEPSPPIDPSRPDSITVNTRKSVMAVFNEAGVPERDRRLAVVSEVLGREVHSVNQLTESEGRKVARAVRPGPPP